MSYRCVHYTITMALPLYHHHDAATIIPLLLRLHYYRGTYYGICAVPDIMSSLFIPWLFRRDVPAFLSFFWILNFLNFLAISTSSAHRLVVLQSACVAVVMCPRTPVQTTPLQVAFHLVYRHASINEPAFEEFCFARFISLVFFFFFFFFL